MLEIISICGKRRARHASDGTTHWGKNVCVSENSTELTSTLKAVAGAGWLHWLVIDWY